MTRVSPRVAQKIRIRLMQAGKTGSLRERPRLVIPLWRKEGPIFSLAG
jgi:hypothetical protein